MYSPEVPSEDLVDTVCTAAELAARREGVPYCEVPMNPVHKLRLTYHGTYTEVPIEKILS